ncbi:MAG TPA: MFS transporter [Conexibacter sp.]|nr:MFS transporter [Conexibacter sp.]
MPELTSRQRLIIVAASLAVGLAFLDETAVVTALRAIQADFGATSAEVQWVVGAYLLALATLMAAAGRLADIYGRRRLFVLGAWLFGAGSLACAAAPGIDALIAARVVQGCGAALLMPLGMANATAALPEERRGWTVGVVSTGATVFLALGPLVGGALVEFADWRWIFLINLPPLAAILAIALRWFPESRAPVRGPLDVLGFLLLLGGLVALTLPLLNMQEWGPRSAATIGLLAASLMLLVAFVLVERRRAHPLIRIELLRDPAVAGLLLALFAIQFTILGLTVYLTFYLQHVLGYGPALAGLLALPTVAAAPFLATPTGRLTDRRGERWPTALAMALAAAALLAIALLARHEEVLLLMPAFLAFGIARPVATVAGTTGAVGAIPRADRGLASALVTQARQLGAVMGVAVLGLVLTSVELSERARLLDGVDAGMSHQSRETLDGILAGSDDAQRLLAQLPPHARAAAQDSAATAFISGFHAAMLVSAGLALAGGIAALLLRRRARRATETAVPLAAPSA